MSADSSSCRAKCHSNFGSITVDVDQHYQNITAGTVHANCGNFCESSVGILSATSAAVTCLTTAHTATSTLPLGIAIAAVARTLTASELLQDHIVVDATAAALAASIQFPTGLEIFDQLSATCGASPAIDDSFDVTISVPAGANPLINVPVGNIASAGINLVAFGPGTNVLPQSLTRLASGTVALTNAAGPDVPIFFGGQILRLRFTYLGLIAAVQTYEVRIIEHVIATRIT
jgi:hypothetical protein